MSDENEKIVSNPDLDKVQEYFKSKKVLKTLRRDIKDKQEQHEVYQELQELLKKVKELREEIKSDEEINQLKDKAGTIKERMDLLKEMIRLELIDKGQQEVANDGRKLKLVNVLKEMRDEEKSNSSR